MRPTQLANMTPVPTNATAVDRRAAVTRTDALLVGSAAGASFVLTEECLPSATTGDLARHPGVLAPSQGGELSLARPVNRLGLQAGSPW